MSFWIELEFGCWLWAENRCQIRNLHQQLKGPSHSFDYLFYSGADVDIDDSAVPIDGSINNSSDLKRRFSPLLIVLFFYSPPPRPVSQWKEIVLIASIHWTKTLSSAVRPSCDRIGQLSKYTFNRGRDYVNNKLITL